MTILSTVIAEYLTYFANGHSKRTTRNVSVILKSFQSKVPTHLTEITPADVDAFCSPLDRSDVYRFVGFHHWLGIKYPEEVFVLLPPHMRIKKLTLEKDWEKLLESVNALRKRLVAPHERLVFLCGFWYSIPLDRVRRMTFQQLYALPQRKEFYSLLVQLGLLSKGEPALGPWLGTCQRSAHYSWIAWSDMKFGEVIRAGNLTKRRLGIRTTVGDRGLPVLSEETLRRLPVPW